MSKAYFGGVPTRPDVKKIRERYPSSELEPGQIIRYGELEEVLIGVKYGSNRFLAVTNRWRRGVEEESGKIIGTEMGVGFRVLTEAEKVELRFSKTRSSIRLSRRSNTISSRIDTKKLSAEERAKNDHLDMINAKIIASGLIKPQAQLPEI
jgi:hypothetical protein